MPGRIATDGVDVAPMSRTRVLVILGSVALGALCLLVGLVLTIITALVDAPAQQMSSGAADGDSVRDRIAAEPMFAVAESAARTPEVAVALPPAVALPDSDGVGPVGVVSGFPRTPLGAVAQLAAIDGHVLTAMSVPTAVATYEAWALPGGVGAADWAQTSNVRAFLAAAQQPGEAKDPVTFVSAIPAAYQIKGMDGDSWLVACVLFDVTARIAESARMGYGTCERMQWTAQGWRIAGGIPPAPAPSTWPGSSLSVQAGWLPLTRPES